MSTQDAKTQETQETQGPTYNRFIVMKSGSRRGRYSNNYYNIAIVEVDPDVLHERRSWEPAAIDSRDAAILAVVEGPDLVHIGKSARSEGFQELEAMRKRCEDLNEAWYAAHPDMREVYTILANT